MCSDSRSTSLLVSSGLCHGRTRTENRGSIFHISQYFNDPWHERVNAILIFSRYLVVVKVGRETPVQAAPAVCRASKMCPALLKAHLTRYLRCIAHGPKGNVEKEASATWLLWPGHPLSLDLVTFHGDPRGDYPVASISKHRRRWAWLLSESGGGSPHLSFDFQFKCLRCAAELLRRRSGT